MGLAVKSSAETEGYRSLKSLLIKLCIFKGLNVNTGT